MAITKTVDGWTKYREELIELCSLPAEEFIARVIADCNLEEKLSKYPKQRPDISYNFVSHSFFECVRYLNIFEDAGDRFAEGSLQLTVENADEIQERLMMRFEMVVVGQLEGWEMPTEELLSQDPLLDTMLNASRRNLDISDWASKFCDEDRIINFFETGSAIKNGYGSIISTYNTFFDLNQRVVVPEHLCDVADRNSKLYRSWNSLISSHLVVDCLLKIEPGVVARPLLDMVDDKIRLLDMYIMGTASSLYKSSSAAFALEISREHLQYLKQWKDEILRPAYQKWFAPIS